MKELFEYRSQLIAELSAIGTTFRDVCLAVSDPIKPLEEGGWSTHQLAAHTRDVAQNVYGMRLRRTLREENPAFEDYDAETWFDANYDPDEPLDSILDELSASVEETVAMLQGLQTEDWKRPSRHEVYGGGFTLQTWAERGLGHIREHLETVAQASQKYQRKS